MDAPTQMGNEAVPAPCDVISVGAGAPTAHCRLLCEYLREEGQGVQLWMTASYSLAGGGLSTLVPATQARHLD